LRDEAISARRCSAARVASLPLVMTVGIVEPCHLTAGEHEAAGAAPDDDRAVREFGSVALFMAVAIDVRDCQRAEFGMADQAGEPQAARLS
jgi:hypothetical protein